MSTQPAQGALPGMPPPLYGASPSKLLAYLDCPRRYRLQYLDRPTPERRRQRAHTSLGNAVHHALRDWWDLSAPTPDAGAGNWIFALLQPDQFCIVPVKGGRTIKAKAASGTPKILICAAST